MRIRSVLACLALLSGTLTPSVPALAYHNGNGKGSTKPVPAGHVSLTQKQIALPDGFKNPFRLHKAREVQERTLVFKVLPAYRSQCSTDGVALPALQNAISALGGGKLGKMFSKHEAPKRTHNEQGEKLTDLSLIYELHYAGNANVEDATNMLLRTGVLEYAEPKYMHRIALTPNDPQASTQYHLGLIQALQAWDITQGDTSVIVGIVDSGIDRDHPDMVANLKLNFADPVDGQDNDANGFVDDYYGWDFAGANFNTITPDGDPMVNGNNTSHGSHVSGISSAVTNNGVGTAGVAFGCKFIGTKCSADNDTRAGGSGFIIGGYQGIVYVADRGAQVINCSWGGGGDASPFEQDIINYASVNKNALVVAACGNSNTNADFFPAYLDKVLSVASTTAQDRRSGFSNYSFKVSICAPGSSILAAQWNDRYALNSGTSMASPVVAGCAALVKSVFPQFGYRQLSAALRTTADASIYNISQNRSFVGQLGSGRVNVFRAVQAQTASLRITNDVSTDGNDNIFIAGDTISFTGTYINDLFTSSTQLRVRLTSLSPTAAQVIADSVMLGQVASQASVTQGSPFKIRVLPGSPLDAQVRFRLDYIDSGSYRAAEYFTMTINQTYINITKNNISTTIASNGRLGYVGNGASGGVGLGLRYKGIQTLYEMGTMTSISADTVADCVRDDNQGYRAAFTSLMNVREVTQPASGGYNVVNRYNDGFRGGAVAPGVEVAQTTYVWSTPADSNYIIVGYVLKNTRPTVLRNLHFGIFSDFDISTNGANDIVRWDSATSMGYAQNVTPGGHLAGIGLLSPYSKNFMPITNDGTNGGAFQIYDGFTLAEKHRAMSSGVNRTNIGAAAGQDISMVAGYGPFTLLPNDSITVAFALVAGPDLNTIKTGVNNANTNNPITSLGDAKGAVKAITLAPNPAQNWVRIIGLEAEGMVPIRVLDQMGRLVGTYQLNAQDPVLELRNMTPGMYYLHLNGKTTKLVVR